MPRGKLSLHPTKRVVLGRTTFGYHGDPISRVNSGWVPAGEHLFLDARHQLRMFGPRFAVPCAPVAIHGTSVALAGAARASGCSPLNDSAMQPCIRES